MNREIEISEEVKEAIAESLTIARTTANMLLEADDIIKMGAELIRKRYNALVAVGFGSVPAAALTAAWLQQPIS